ncbi:Smr/MutS family protein [Sphingopyxis sp. BSNA05]|uniref:Smr/MutS family protein n=1 Tax=Sphingopyxis sp. BSNA05 TaxID=1236614 RepID=UPI00349F392D
MGSPIDEGHGATRCHGRPARLYIIVCPRTAGQRAGTQHCRWPSRDIADYRQGAERRRAPSRGGRGAIRAAIADWLAASRHASHIATVRRAHPRHGGAGALYIILRRRR